MTIIVIAAPASDREPVMANVRRQAVSYSEVSALGAPSSPRHACGLNVSLFLQPCAPFYRTPVLG